MPAYSRATNPAGDDIEAGGSGEHAEAPKKRPLVILTLVAILGYVLWPQISQYTSAHSQAELAPIMPTTIPEQHQQSLQPARARTPGNAALPAQSQSSTHPRPAYSAYYEGQPQQQQHAQQQQQERLPALRGPQYAYGGGPAAGAPYGGGPARLAEAGPTPFQQVRPQQRLGLPPTRQPYMSMYAAAHGPSDGPLRENNMENNFIVPAPIAQAYTPARTTYSDYANFFYSPPPPPRGALKSPPPPSPEQLPAGFYMPDARPTKPMDWDCGSECYKVQYNIGGPGG